MQKCFKELCQVKGNDYTMKPALVLDYV